jgi:hypothetical protein
VVCVALVALGCAGVGSSSAAAASPTRGATYAHGPLESGTATEAELKVTRRGKAFSDIELGFSIGCSNGREDFASLQWLSGLERPARVPIRRDGSFSAYFAVAGTDILDPFTVSEEYWLSGRFIRRGRAARLVVRARLVGEGGSVCDSGDRRVTARRSPSI